MQGESRLRTSQSRHTLRSGLSRGWYVGPVQDVQDVHETLSVAVQLSTTQTKLNNWCELTCIPDANLLTSTLPRPISSSSPRGTALRGGINVSRVISCVMRRSGGADIEWVEKHLDCLKWTVDRLGVSSLGCLADKLEESKPVRQTKNLSVPCAR